LNSTSIALFALAGGGSVFIAPLAGRAGDRGWSRPATLIAHAVAIVAALLAALALASGVSRVASIAMLAVAAFFIDGA
jgi:hypothetical protein